ncbi:MAG TPA: dockerin type I domain-containing protein [Pirellulales bacterium]
MFANGYDPHNGEQFHLFNADSINGTFTNINLPALDPGLHWDTSLLYTQGIVRVSISGDANGDGIVNGQDLALVSSSWLSTGTNSADVNGDSIVNAQDLATISSNWLYSYDAVGPIPGIATVVPEPSAIGLVIAGLVSSAIALHRSRRRHHLQ